MDFPGAGAGSDADKDPRELDPALEGAAGDSYVKCGKCQACYPMDLEVCVLVQYVLFSVARVYSGVCCKAFYSLLGGVLVGAALLCRMALEVC